jgi:hypothetical protein
MTRHANPADDANRTDEGFTLVELLVYSLLLVVVISIAGGLLVNSLRAESTVRAVTSASTTAQQTADSVESGLRNSSAFEIQAVNSGADQMLVARVVRGSTAAITWKCAAWYFSRSLGTVRYTEVAPAASGTATIAAPSAAALAGWTLLSDRVTPTSGTTIFSGSQPTLSIAFTTVGGAGKPPVAVSSSASSRAEVWESGTCFSLTD